MTPLEKWAETASATEIIDKIDFYRASNYDYMSRDWKEVNDILTQLKSELTKRTYQ